MSIDYLRLISLQVDCNGSCKFQVGKLQVVVFQLGTWNMELATQFL